MLVFYRKIFIEDFTEYITLKNFFLQLLSILLNLLIILLIDFNYSRFSLRKKIKTLRI